MSIPRWLTKVRNASSLQAFLSWLLCYSSITYTVREKCTSDVLAIMRLETIAKKSFLFRRDVIMQRRVGRSGEFREVSWLRMKNIIRELNCSPKWITQKTVWEAGVRSRFHPQVWEFSMQCSANKRNSRVFSFQTLLFHIDCWWEEVFQRFWIIYILEETNFYYLKHSHSKRTKT